MKVLITNDDSINYIGLKILAQAAVDFGFEVMIIAPHEEKSACSHSITLRKNIRLYQHEEIINGVKTYSIDGTPADCVKFAKKALNFDFDLVLSGINNGYNLADDICYSGTASAALQAELIGKKGIAFSTEPNNLEGCIYLKDVITFIFDTKFLDKTDVLNVNIPPKALGIKISKQGKRSYNSKYIEIEKNIYTSVNIDDNCRFIEKDSDDLSDYRVVDNNYISISMLSAYMNIK